MRSSDAGSWRRYCSTFDELIDRATPHARGRSGRAPHCPSVRGAGVRGLQPPRGSLDADVLPGPLAADRQDTPARRSRPDEAHVRSLESPRPNAAERAPMGDRLVPCHLLAEVSKTRVGVIEGVVVVRALRWVERSLACARPRVEVAGAPSGVAPFRWALLPYWLTGRPAGVPRRRPSVRAEGSPMTDLHVMPDERTTWRVYDSEAPAPLSMTARRPRRCL
jgi:hypothetical protein